MKRLVLGFILGVLVSTSVNVIANELIDKAEFNNVRVSYNGNILDLNQNLISVQTQGSDNAVNYMPVRAVLEGLGYTVNWNGGENMIEVSNSTVNESIVSARSSSDSVNSATVDEWITVEDIMIVYDYRVSQGANGAGIVLNKTGTEPLFYSEVGAEDNVVRIIRDGNDFKFSKADLLAIGIDLTPIR